MLTIDPAASVLLIIDIQTRLMPVIENAQAVIENVRRLRKGAVMFEVPVCYTEQNASGLGSTEPRLSVDDARIVHKMTFDSVRAATFDDVVPSEKDVVAVGCEAHVCVLQTVLGLLDRSRRVYLVADAIGSRTQANRAAAIRRMERHGAEIVTSEMVLFEWLGSAKHARFRDAMDLIR